MIRRITLENYMSHAHTVIEPAAGLTVLVGPNNCGKSAVVSALETLARNVAGDFMVRHGEREAKVTLETDDGHTLVWRRKGDKVGYEVDGRAVDRLRGGVPEDLHDLLKLPLVESARGGGEAFDVHFGHQKSPIFLLDEPESRAATFFSASSDAGRLLEIQDRHRDKVRDRKRRRADVVDEIDRLDAQLAALAPLDELVPLLDAADVMQSDLSARSDAIRGIEQTISRIASARRAGERCGRRARVLESLAVP